MEPIATPPEPSPSSKPSSTRSSLSLSEALDELLNLERRSTVALELLASRFDALITLVSENADKWATWMSPRH